MSDEMWLVALLSVLTLWALVASIGWLRMRNESREWEAVAITLGNEYDKLFLEHCRRTAQTSATWQRPKQGVTWLN